MNESLKAVLKIRARQYIKQKLCEYNGDRHKTARALCIGLSTLYRKMAELNIKRR